MNREEWQGQGVGLGLALPCLSVQSERPPASGASFLLVAKAEEAFSQMGEEDCGFLHSQPKKQSPE